MSTRGARSIDTRRSGRGSKAAEPKGLAAALFSKTQRRVLGLLFGQPERSFYANELIDLTGSGSGAVQRELARLSESGLLTSRLVGRQRHYQANSLAPIFDELRSIVVKTAGFAEPLRAALAPLAGKIRLALLYGSLAAGTARAMSDIDVLVVADGVTLEELYRVLGQAEARLGRKTSPALYTSAEFEKRRSTGNSFLIKLLAGPYIVLLGDPRAVAAAR